MPAMIKLRSKCKNVARQAILYPIRSFATTPPRSARTIAFITIMFATSDVSYENRPPKHG